ncbi:unnamed protein product [Ilex paraguariensis]|uniref:Uncharacterized protein n=1 Tax=Ilex paraguariensis TaxID=185542 RepID=A0ABC8THL4_9AQUA
MASMQLQQQGNGGISNRIVAFDHDHSDHEEQKQQKPGWLNFLSFVGPGFLVSMAYLDPGNMETDLQAGASYGYELLWVILVGLIFALLIQSLAANLGVSTGKHLAELCKAEYPILVKYCLWLLSEVSVIAADIPEGTSSTLYSSTLILIGTAFGLNILFHIPLWAGVLLTGLSTLLLLGLQRYGVRKLEILITVLVFVMAACFFGEMVYVKPPTSDVLKGLFVPKLSGHGAVGNCIALLGALVMPHNLFLHSALVLSRKIPNSVRGINDACRFFLMEAAFALFVALLINVAMISVAAAVCSAKDLSDDNKNRCNNLNLDSASFLLKNVLGKSSSTVYAIALLASGQSSAITATYAGQFIMQGFLNLKMKAWKRSLLTRSIAITPSLIVSVIGGSAASGQLIIIASIIVICWILGLGIIGINVYYLSTGFVGWLINNSLPKVGNVFIGILVFPVMAVYVVSVIYLIFRKDVVVTFIEPTKNDNAQIKMEHGQGDADGVLGSEPVPFREDLSDIPLPE